MGLTKAIRVQSKTASVTPSGFFVRKKLVVAPFFALIVGKVQEKIGNVA